MACEREALALIFALKKFLVYLLLLQPFQITTDHQALQYTIKKKDVHGRLARWLVFLCQYDFTIGYKPGADNQDGDFQSTFSSCEHAVDNADQDELALIYSDDKNIFEPALERICRRLLEASMENIELEYYKAVRQAVKQYLVWDGQLFRTTRLGLNLVIGIQKRVEMLEAFYDDIGLRDAESQPNLLSD